MAEYDKLKAYISGELVGDDQAIDEDTSLFSSRVVHSRNLMSLVQFIEEEYGFRVSPMDLTLENFDTIGRIVAYIANKK